MSKIKKICLSAMFFIIMIFICNKASATNITITPSEPKVGDTITVNVSVPNVHTASVTANVSGVVSGSIKVVGGDLAGNPKDYSKSAQFKCEKEGTITVEVTPDSSAVLNGTYINVSQKKSVTVKAATNNSGDSGNNSGNNTNVETKPTTKSSEARLRDLGITPNDFKGFKRDTYTYNVEVPNNVSKVNVYAKAVNSKAKISGIGDVTLKEGKNSVNVVVTAEDGTKKTYTINITRSTETEEIDGENTSEARLKNLGIKPKEYDFSGFKKDNLQYSVQVPNDVTEIEIYAEAISSKATIKGTGKIELKEGKNTANIEVTAEDGTKKVYVIEIERKEEGAVEEETSNEKVKLVGLSQLLLGNLNLNPNFDSEIYEYKLELTEDLDSLDIQAKANDNKSVIEIIGNENLNQGENIITILVSNAETEEVATYQIIVNKNVSDEVAGSVDWLNPSTWGLKEKIIIGIALILILIIVVAIIIKIRLSRQEDDDLDLPGAEELDRALSEHQELAEGNEEKNEYKIKQKEPNLVEELYESKAQEENISNKKSDIEMAQEYFETYSKRKGKHF